MAWSFAVADIPLSATAPGPTAIDVDTPDDALKSFALVAVFAFATPPFNPNATPVEDAAELRFAFAFVLTVATPLLAATPLDTDVAALFQCALEDDAVFAKAPFTASDVDTEVACPPVSAWEAAFELAFDHLVAVESACDAAVDRGPSAFALELDVATAWSLEIDADAAFETPPFVESASALADATALLLSAAFAVAVEAPLFTVFAFAFAAAEPPFAPAALL